MINNKLTHGFALLLGPAPLDRYMYLEPTLGYNVTSKLIGQLQTSALPK